jgi:hypothetical protein
MALSTSSGNPAVIGIDRRESLYYGKYQYRARLKLDGLNRTHLAKTMLDVLHRLKKYGRQKEIASLDLDCLERFINWRNKYATPIDKADRQALIRIESVTAGVFSNDLQLLQTLESIAGKDSVDYTEIDTSIPTGVRYFVKEPKYKYRVYLKSKAVKDKFVEDLRRFIDRYKDTQTTIIASSSLDSWLNGNARNWAYRYCSSHYYIEYNEESTHSLIGIMFGDMIKRRFKLEKRPD